MAKLVSQSLLILILTTLTAACSKKTVTADDVPVVTGGAVVALCANGTAPYPSRSSQLPLHVIRSHAEYDSLQHLLGDSMGVCAGTTPPAIDFSRSTLLGRQTTGSGCRLTVPVSRMSIVRDSATRTVLWKIVHVEQGRCEPLHHAMSWVLVPAIDPGYSVVVMVETEVVE